MLLLRIVQVFWKAVADGFGFIVNSKPFLYGIILMLATLLFWGGRKFIELKSQWNAQSSAIEKSLTDKNQELLVTLSDMDMRSHLKDEEIVKLLDSLKLKPKNVISYKRIGAQRVIHDTLTEYELIEIGDYQTRFEVEDDCFTATIDLTGNNPIVNAQIETNLIDINYTKRRPLFNKEWLPNWGKKETFQTLISECSGDSITKNQKITTK